MLFHPHPFHGEGMHCGQCGMPELDHIWKCEKCGSSGNGFQDHCPHCESDNPGT